MEPVNQAENAKLFIEDREHQRHFDRLIWAMRIARDRAAAAVPEWEQLRDIASETKEHVLSHLADYLEQFEENAKRNGVHVHWANDAHDHNQIVADIMAKHGAPPR